MKLLRIALPTLLVTVLGFGIAVADDEKKKQSGKKEKKEPAKIEKVTKTDAEWKKQLTPMQYKATRKKGTERKRTGETWDNYKPGTYSCVCCDLLLFNSETKFKSGTGWPSFYDAAIKGHVVTKEDKKFGWSRTEFLCARCDAHLGHVFDDVPDQPTGLRYCANSAALRFKSSKDTKSDSKKPEKKQPKEKKKSSEKKSGKN